ncbi:hypothetical protein Moror_13045 [Moniliophthora roreri MCA 2997]|uniref:Uncharacterized protein n=2 Tax=Moniliophthora roreri TaxID=221103 RepID=V2XJF0_MONRO|nr:hypothetical protein Moror_13045 [Moniliophthora roreri MCA 2997]KAI3604554.1 hypothetical protein WG66_008488 [Moniliophthora roreri]
MHLSLPLISLAAIFGVAQAVDNRLLFEVPAGETVEEFSPKFQDSCSTWGPAIDQGLTLQTIYVNPGDFRGQNADTQVKLICSYHNDETGATITFTKDVAEDLGATLL